MKTFSLRRASLIFRVVPYCSQHYNEEILLELLETSDDSQRK